VLLAVFLLRIIAPGELVQQEGGLAATDTHLLGEALERHQLSGREHRLVEQCLHLGVQLVTAVQDLLQLSGHTLQRFSAQ